MLEIFHPLPRLDSRTVTNVFPFQTVVTESMYIDTVIVSITSSMFILFASVFVNFLEHKYLLRKFSLSMFSSLSLTRAITSFSSHAVVNYGCSLLCLIAIIWATNTLTTLILVCLFIGLLSKSFNIMVGATVLIFPTSLRSVISTITLFKKKKKQFRARDNQ